ncbi:hypothetical protein FR483_n641L [Paramecium bursaria Chlorella virus FR483]|uniref:Uncharacterized protein n641L n=1 Tax=Paramecium bursaria Chlorella virus FR483 TaxID=399781 RepID=A7J7Z5_PBCVF|nr:hypothetical protein FR483_n641L [Paramecium bursaria Chlorella virus FR483]ABT15926.1 hypothetical protein FR483_n641L [Paramecium bursaria Chlorella virus FR483]
MTWCKRLGSLEAHVLILNPCCVDDKRFFCDCGRHIGFGSLVLVCIVWHDFSLQTIINNIVLASRMCPVFFYCHMTSKCL